MYDQLALVHLFFIAPAPVLGAYLLLVRKGTPKHRLLGKIYMAGMFISAIVSLFMPAKVGPQFVFHWGWIHLLSWWTLISITVALWAIKKGDIRTHRNFMVGLYVGMMIAFVFTFSEGRLLAQLVS